MAPIPSFSFNIKLVLSAFLIVLALHPSAWKIALNDYQNDSLFVLTHFEILGLLVITIAMTIALFYFNINKTRYLHDKIVDQYNNNQVIQPQFIIVDLILTTLLFVLFWAIAPQIHYTYYQQIMDGLQSQWVIGGGMRVDRAIRFATLSQENSIADHANGFAFWICLTCSALYPIMKLRPMWVKRILGIVISILSIRLIQVLLNSY